MRRRTRCRADSDNYRLHAGGNRGGQGVIDLHHAHQAYRDADELDWRVVAADGYADRLTYYFNTVICAAELDAVPIVTITGCTPVATVVGKV